MSMSSIFYVDINRVTVNIYKYIFSYTFESRFLKLKQIVQGFQKMKV
jgi:hypothetical protein